MNDSYASLYSLGRSVSLRGLCSQKFRLCDYVYDCAYANDPPSGHARDHGHDHDHDRVLLPNDNVLALNAKSTSVSD